MTTLTPPATDAQQHQALCDELAGIRVTRETLYAYSNLFSVQDVTVLHPKTEDDLRRIFECARRTHRRVTFRAGGHSFDAQSLGDDLVVCMRAFTGDIAVDADADPPRVTVRPGTTWGEILRTLGERGLVPAVTVTTEHATAAGTLSGDCLSRFSAAYGKEGTRIRRFKIMTPDGVVRTCERERCRAQLDGGGALTLEDRLYLGAIGGLGYLGAVLEITYDVLKAPEGEGPVVVETTVRKHGNLDSYVNSFVETVRTMHDDDSSPAHEDMHDASYTGLSTGDDGDVTALEFRSTLKRGAKGRPMLLYKPEALVRVPVEWLFRWRAFNAFLWWFAYRFMYRESARWVNELPGYTFFMDGNVRAKHAARRFGFRLKTLQQTFIVPTDFAKANGADEAKADLRAWLMHVHRVFRWHRVRPTFEDVLWLPRDLAFPLSATGRTAGFAVSYAFETNNAKRLAAARAAFEELSADLHRDPAWKGGRVYLVKNVVAAAKDVRGMYGADADWFFALKKQVDPAGVLTNPFLERTFGSRP